MTEEPKPTIPVEPKPTRKLSKKMIILIAAGAIVFLCICVVVAAALTTKPTTSTPTAVAQVVASATASAPVAGPTNTSAPTNTVGPTYTPAPTSTSGPTDTPMPTSTPTATPNPNLIEPGTFIVGTDIKPGLYKGETSGCYWERLKDLSGGFGGIIANGNSNGQFYIQVSKTDFALSVECEVVLLDPLPVSSGEYPQTLQPGDYLVGIDIKPGRYKGTDSDCYWERLKDLSGGFDAIIANGNSKGQFYIQVSKTDFALSVGCEVAWVSD